MFYQFYGEICCYHFNVIYKLMTDTFKDPVHRILPVSHCIEHTDFANNKLPRFI